MKTRRTFLMALTCAAVALGMVVLPALADELFGRITEVDVTGKTIVVTKKGGEDKVTVKVPDSTVVVVGKEDEERKVDLKRLHDSVEKSEGRGVFAKVTHENGTASKINIFRKGEGKKGEGKKGEGRKKEEPKS